MVGFVYPAYCSIKAIESTNKDDDTQWLTYWLIFALFKIIEGFADVFLSRLPLYFFMKMAFLVYLFYPTTQGAKVLYENVIKVYVVPKVLPAGGEASNKKVN